MTSDRMFPRCLPALVAGLLLATTTLPAVAEDAKANREREALRRLQAQQQKLTQEKSDLEAEKTKLLGTQESLKKEAAAARREAGKVTTLTQEAAALKAEIAILKQQLADALTLQLQAKGDLEKAERTKAEQIAARQQAEGASARQTKEVQACEAKNLALYRYGSELLVRYQNKGWAELLGQAEPFTGIAQVGMENLLEEYRDKLDGQQIEPTRAAATDSAAPH